MSSIKHYGKASNPEEDELRKKIKALNEEAAENFDNPTWRRERAQEMTESIYEGFQHENLLALMAEVENLPFTGRSFVKETRGLKAYWLARGGYIEASTLHSEVMEIPRDIIGFQVQEFEEKLETNFAETAATLVELAIDRMDAMVNQRLLALLQAAVPFGHPSYVHGNLTTNGILSAVNTALAEVRDVSKTRQVTIIGRPSMTEKIMDDLIDNNSYSGFLPNSNEQFMQQGILGTYRGANIVSLTNYLDENDQPFFPANEIYIMSSDASKFAFWGGMKTKEYTEDDNWYWHFLGKKEFGGVVHRPERIRRIVDDETDA
jgi:hypothetical protein